MNPYSWNTKATVVWVDQPVGTGFSYADKDVYERDEDEVAADVFSFIQGYFKKYPALKKLPLFITGESYGGHVSFRAVLRADESAPLTRRACSTCRPSRTRS